VKKILIVVGTRPNFIKVTQFRKVIERYPNLDLKIVHTGQHFDKNMAEVFFSQFKLSPDYFLNISASSPATQMGEIMIKLEELIKGTYRPDIIITPGDVNSTLAVAIVANKLNITLAHLESGLRSNDRNMPEEINRILTDEISDHFFVTEKSGLENLRAEEKKGEIHFVGNTMIDTLVGYENEIADSNVLKDLKISKQFILMTIHRPSNVDSEEGLLKLSALIDDLASRYQLVFPIHPRTRANIKKYQLEDSFYNKENVIITDALGYFEFQKLVSHSKLVLTDSGGIQEETTFRQVPCLTLRTSTERPSTTEIGTNTLLDFDVQKILMHIEEIEKGEYKKGQVPELWDGKSTDRIVEIINNILG
jgi:UDP-N-acetylglucosamine 2-epimerase (non-hydrolysing)